MQALNSQQKNGFLNPERIRNIFLGFNDGLVEVLGAVSGLFAAFHSVSLILAASITIAAAGALSMAAGAYVALSSEHEARNNDGSHHTIYESPYASSFLVGVSYVFGSLFPIVPVLFGARSFVASVIASALAVVGISFALASVSGMNIVRRITTNFIIIAVTVGVTYAIGLTARQILGITL